MNDENIQKKLERLRRALKAKEIEFVDLYLQGMPPAEAYQEAGLAMAPDPIGAEHLLSAPTVRLYIETMERVVVERSTLTLEKIDERLADLAMADIVDMVEIGQDYTDNAGNLRTPVTIKDPATLTPGQRAAITSIKPVIGGLEIKTEGKVKALELLARRRGGFTEQVDLNIGGHVKIFANVGDNSRGPRKGDIPPDD